MLWVSLTSVHASTLVSLPQYPLSAEPTSTFGESDGAVGTIKSYLGAYPLPVYSREERLLGEPRRTTSPPSGRWVPHPPPAAPAAGGWGSPDLRRVYSVGSVWGLAGGVGEQAARPEWLFAAEVFLSGDGGLRSSVADLPSSACSELGGAAGHGFNPWPDPAGRRIWGVSFSKMATWWFAAEPMILGVTSPEAVSEDFPVATGMLRRSKASGRAQAAARLPLVRDAGDAGVQKDLGVKFSVFWTFL